MSAARMKAIQVTRYGGAEVLELRDVDCPQPAPGEARIKLAYAGVNFIDVYTRSGLYAHSHTYANKPPFTLGREGCGTVDAIGAEVQGLAVGDRVAWCLALGSYAQYACVPAWRLVKIPDAMSRKIATTLMLQGCTAHYQTHSLFPLEPGHTCLIHAASGGVGRLMVQLAKLRGAVVFATVGSEEKAAQARALGADHVILYREQDFAAQVLRETFGEGVDVVYDSVGQATIAGSIRCCKRRGTVSNFGAASGAVTSVDPLELAEAGSLFFTRPHMADYMRDAEEVNWRGSEMFAHVAAGRLQVSIDRVLPLAEAAAAHRILEGRGTTGKLLLATD
jgi:NADPH2:quinone reductase